jgi:uncharacterized protein
VTSAGATERTRVRRLPERAVTTTEAVHAVLDAGLVAHVAVLDADAQPYVVPVAYARDGDHVLFHGSTGSRLFRSLGAGAPTCLTVTLLDGLVLARSAFESSMNYRGVMVLGTCSQVEGEAKDRALRVISDHLLPGRWDDIRPPSRKELAATLVLSLSLAECSVKVRDGGPEDLPEDLDRTCWAGHIPIREMLGAPIPSDAAAAAQPIPDYLKEWTR